MDTKFNIWKDKVDKIVYKRIGYTLDELPDELYRDYFDNKCTIECMADIVIKNNSDGFV